MRVSEAFQVATQLIKIQEHPQGHPIPTGIAYDSTSQLIYINDKVKHNVQVLQYGP